MVSAADLRADVAKVVSTLPWNIRDGRIVPDTTSVSLGLDGVRITGVVLYADLADSTIMVDSYPDWFAAEVYKAFLVCAAKLIRHEGGVITSYDGDRVMGIFIGDGRHDRAVRAAQKINWAVANIIRPRISAVYPQSNFQLRHVCGIDESTLLAAKTGARNNNDLVWVGPAANYAAKMAAMDEAWSTYISPEVWRQMTDRVRLEGGVGQTLWEPEYWPGRQDKFVFRSNSWWNVDSPP